MLDTYLLLFTHVHKKYGDEYLHCANLCVFTKYLLNLPRITKIIIYAVSAEEKNEAKVNICYQRTRFYLISY